MEPPKPSAPTVRRVAEIVPQNASDGAQAVSGGADATNDVTGAIGPVADAVDGTKAVAAQAGSNVAALTQSAFNALIKSDVGAAKAIDGLLGVAHDKQLAGARSDLEPIGFRRILRSEIAAEHANGAFKLARLVRSPHPIDSMRVAAFHI